MKVEEIARICHEANRAYCRVHHDHSQLSWNEAPHWQHESAIKGVHFTQTNPNATPESQHQAWVADKQKDGWVYGKSKNPDTKEHPCIREYSELPEIQRKKDELFLAIVRALS